jgi:hypothetical protein
MTIAILCELKQTSKQLKILHKLPLNNHILFAYALSLLRGLGHFLENPSDRAKTRALALSSLLLEFAAARRANGVPV